MLIPRKSEKQFKCKIQIFVVVLINLATYISVYALTPNEILVIANRNVSGSVELAKYYIEKRDIPNGNILTLRLTKDEKCNRLEYEEKVVRPVRKFLKSNKGIHCIITMFGVPLKVAPEMTRSEIKEGITLRKNKKEIEKRIVKSKTDVEMKQLETELIDIGKKITEYTNRNDKGASLDSELALVKQQNYPLSMWTLNPYFAGFRGKKLRFAKNDVMMVCRLDAPTVDDVKRVIDDSLFAEKNGLTGKAYFDARWPNPEKNNLKSYAYYDRSIHLAAEKINRSYLLPVIKDERSELFQPGQCPDAALYCGWYKLAEYIDAFTWKKGSIGYHIASAECTTLKNKSSNVWCKRMLEKGIAATIGPVGEPYVQAFPIPELFFGLLVKGEMTLVECYFASLPFISWKMVLIGDPLYNPFKKRSKKTKDLFHYESILDAEKYILPK